MGWVNPPSRSSPENRIPRRATRSSPSASSFPGTLSSSRRDPALLIAARMEPERAVPRDRRAETRRRCALEEQRIEAAAREGQSPQSRREAEILAQRERRLAWNREYAARRRAERRGTGWRERHQGGSYPEREWSRDCHPSLSMEDVEEGTQPNVPLDEAYLFGEAPGQCDAPVCSAPHGSALSVSSWGQASDRTSLPLNHRLERTSAAEALERVVSVLSSTGWAPADVLRGEEVEREGPTSPRIDAEGAQCNSLTGDDEGPITFLARSSLEGHDRRQEGPSALAAAIDASVQTDSAEATPSAPVMSDAGTQTEPTRREDVGSGPDRMLTTPDAAVKVEPPPSAPLPRLSSESDAGDGRISKVRTPTLDVGVQVGWSAWDRFSRGVQATLPTQEAWFQVGCSFRARYDGCCQTDAVPRISTGTQCVPHRDWNFDLRRRRVVPLPEAGHYLLMGLPYSEMTRWGIVNIPLRPGTVAETYSGVDAHLGRIWNQAAQGLNWVTGFRFRP